MRPLFDALLAMIGAAVLLFANATFAETTVSAGFGGSNGQCGTFEPNASISYDRDSDDVAAHTYLTVGPNGGCDGQGITIDAAITKIYSLRGPWGGFITGGYDQRTVPFEYVPDATDPDITLNGAKVNLGTKVVSPAAIAGIRYDCGDECSIRLGYNAVETDLAELKSDGTTHKKASPIFLAANYEVMDKWELSADTNFTVTNLRVSRDVADEDIFITAGVTFGAHKLDSPAEAKHTISVDRDGNGTVDEAITLDEAGAPSPLYQLAIGWRF